MVARIVDWPAELLEPGQIDVNQVVFSRSGGRTLGGLERAIKTDRGHWEFVYHDIAVHGVERRRAWNYTRVAVSGRTGIIRLPIWSLDSSPWPADARDGRILTPFSDGSTFSDGAFHSQPAVLGEMVAPAALGDAVVAIRPLLNMDEMSGIRFSYQDALYETGVPISIVSGVWTVPIFPLLRAAIPADAELVCDRPTCLVKLATDREMDAKLSEKHFDLHTVSFVEAADYWNDIATS